MSLVSTAVARGSRPAQTESAVCLALNPARPQAQPSPAQAFLAISTETGFPCVSGAEMTATEEWLLCVHKSLKRGLLSGEHQGQEHILLTAQ